MGAEAKLALLEAHAECRAFAAGLPDQATAVLVTEAQRPYEGWGFAVGFRTGGSQPQRTMCIICVADWGAAPGSWLPSTLLDCDCDLAAAAHSVWRLLRMTMRLHVWRAQAVFNSKRRGPVQWLCLLPAR